jgi:hypothetical protein
MGLGQSGADAAPTRMYTRCPTPASPPGYMYSVLGVSVTVWTVKDSATAALSQLCVPAHVFMDTCCRPLSGMSGRPTCSWLGYGLAAGMAGLHSWRHLGSLACA